MIFAVLLPLLFTLLVPYINRFKHKVHPGVFVFFIPLIIFTYFTQFVTGRFKTSTYSYTWIPSLEINLNFHVDGLSLLFALLISGIGALVVLYSIFYLDRTEKLGHFYIYLLIFMTAMLGVVLSDNVFVLYTFWELTSISSFLLIGYWHFRKRSRYGALKSLLITVLGGLSMFAALILLSLITETTSIQGMIENKELILNNHYLPFVLILILLGAFTKSSQFPFHIWLPDAMEAPTPVSAYLHSATMVKAGLYLIARFFPIFSTFEWFFILVSLGGMITLCWGSYMAVKQTDLKAILAFSTISQLGMIMAMLGFGTKAAVFAAVFHILNHATFKGSLFMVAGIVDLNTGTRDIRKLGGLLTFMPMTATLAIFGTFSMAGVPLPFLNGYYSKELFFESAFMLNKNVQAIATFLTPILPYLAVFGSIFTFVYSMYFYFGVFGKQKKTSLTKTPKKTSFGILIPPALLTLGVIGIGLFPNIPNKYLLTHAATAIQELTEYQPVKFWHGFNTPFIMTLVVVGVGSLLYIFKDRWVDIYKTFPGRLSFNKVYDYLIQQLDTFSFRITQTYMTGSLRTYMGLIIGTLWIVTLVYMVLTGGFTIQFDNLADITFTEIAVVVIIMIAAIGTIFANHNVAAILILGITGYGVAMLFVIYRAPDLALTQLVIETVTVTLFLLCFYHLPNLRKRTESLRTKTVNVLIAGGFGLMMTLIGISAHSTNWFEKISDYFLETALPIGGGTNVVNVILVDMRGIDTLFEIAVLGIAGLAIFSLIRLKDKGAK